MPITLTLSDEFAGEMMKQITEGLTKRTVAPTPAPEILYAAGVDKTHAAVDKLAIGETINVTRFSRAQGVPSEAVSSAMQTLKRNGVVEMIQKGTWRKKAPRVAYAA